jgi:hypothetical protein
MVRSLLAISLTFSALVYTTTSLRSAEPSAADETKYTLRYKFQAGEDCVWKVEHKARVRTTVSGTTQTADTTSISAKRWKISDVKPDGAFSLVHSVDYVDMRQQMSDRDEERYDSREGTKPGPGFGDVAKAVATPLTIATLDARGKVLKREEKQSQPNANKGQMTVELPEEPVAIGKSWNQPFDIDVTVKDGAMKRIKAQQHYVLEAVENGLATIRVETQWLTPNRTPEIEAQLIQRDTSGTVKFDIAAGKVVFQQVDIDRNVIGFQGDASSMHYTTRFTEELLPAAEAKTAAKPKKAK